MDFSGANCIDDLDNSFGVKIFHKYYWGDCKLQREQEFHCGSRKRSPILCAFYTEVRDFLSKLYQFVKKTNFNRDRYQRYAIRR